MKTIHAISFMLFTQTQLTCLMADTQKTCYRIISTWQGRRITVELIYTYSSWLNEQALARDLLYFRPRLRHAGNHLSYQCLLQRHHRLDSVLHFCNVSKNSALGWMWKRVEFQVLQVRDLIRINCETSFSTSCLKVKKLFNPFTPKGDLIDFTIVSRLWFYSV